MNLSHAEFVSSFGITVGPFESEPATGNVLKPLDRIEFGAEHVAAVFIRPAEAQ